MHDITYFQFTILFSLESLHTFIVNSRYLLFQNTIQNTLNSRHIIFYTHDITNHIKKINIKCNTEKKLQLKYLLLPPQKKTNKNNTLPLSQNGTQKNKKTPHAYNKRKNNFKQKKSKQEVRSKYYQNH